LIEIAIVLAILGVVLLVSTTLLNGALDVYAKVSNETETIKQARLCLELISRDVREGLFVDISDLSAGAPLANVNDAILIESARFADNPATPDPDNGFSVDIDGVPQTQSIVLFYLNTTPEGANQLIRHQLYYAEDLNLLTPPFQLLNPPAGPYVGQNIVIVDGVGNPISINRNTGGTAGVNPFMAPKVLMNASTSFDVVDDGINPVEVRLTCQVTDRYGRSVTTRLSTMVQPRN
jgi:type II secretory pathway pseudopilin PulG